MFRSLILLAAAMAAFSWVAPAAAKRETPAELAKTHGLVIARVHATLPTALVGDPRPGVISWPIVWLQPVGATDADDGFMLAPSKLAIDAYGSWLPAGRYRLGGFRGGDWSKAPEIEVVAGRLTTLGDLLEVMVGGSDIRVLQLQHPEADAALPSWIAEVGPVLSSPEPLRWTPGSVSDVITVDPAGTSGTYGGGWLADTWRDSLRDANVGADIPTLRAQTDPARLQAQALERQPIRNDESAVDADGRQYFGTRFGRIRVRETDGRWRTIDTGTFAAIDSLEWHDGRLLAGTDAGTLLASGDGGMTWRTLRRLPKAGAITDIDRVGERWLIVAARREADVFWRPHASAATVYVARADDFADLAESANFEQKWGRNRSMWTDPNGALAGDRYLLAAYPDMHAFDIGTGRWAEVKKGGSTGRVLVSSTSGAVTASGNGVFLSIDGGVTWKRVPWTKGFAGAALFDSGTQGWLVDWRSPKVWANEPVLNLLGGGGGWREPARPPFVCEIVLRDAADQPNLCAAADGTVFRRGDEAWVVEAGEPATSEP